MKLESSGTGTRPLVLVQKALKWGENSTPGAEYNREQRQKPMLISRKREAWITRKDTDPPAPLTETRVNEMINGALSRFGKQELPTALKPINDALAGLSGIKEMVEKLSTKPAGDQGDQGQGQDQGDQGRGKGKGKDVIPPELNARFQELERSSKKLAEDLAAEKKARDDAEKRALETERASQVRGAMNGLQFASVDAGDDAFGIVLPMVRKDESGHWIGGPEDSPLPVAEFVKQYITTKKPHFLAATGRSGAGSGGGQQRGKQTFSFEAIKPGMTPDDAVAAAKEIEKALVG